MFQSTHPRRVRPCVVLQALVFAVSIHAPTQGATLSANIRLSRAVSIHAPTQGATVIPFPPAFPTAFQSTHPRRVRPVTGFIATGYSSFNPRTHAGCDIIASAIEADCEFQSTHPRRVRPKRAADKLLADVSIHAPTQGATGCRSSAGRCSTSFNPRTHAGCDLQSVRNS